MPKASVDENGDASFSATDIGPAGNRSVVDSVAGPSGPQGATESQLGTSVLAAHPSHSTACGCIGAAHIPVRAAAILAPSVAPPRPPSGASFAHHLAREI
jgi:hypothetical protein